MLTITGLTVKFPSRFGDFTAIENVDMSIKAGEIHGLVGESGAGKSTVMRIIAGEDKDYQGEVVFSDG